MKKKLFVFVALFIFLGIGCSDEDPGRNKLNEKSFRLSYTINDPTAVVTRSTMIDLEEREDRISSFYILFFEYTSGGTGSFIEAIDVMENYSGQLSNSGTVEIDFPAGSRLKNTEKYKMLLCANIHEYASVSSLQELISFCDGKTEREVNYLLTNYISGVAPGSGEEDDDSNQMYSEKLPMSTTVVKEANASEIGVELIRAVARFDVFCEADGYELYSASLWNAYTKGYVWENLLTDFSDPRTERYYGVKANSNKEIVGALYAFENYVSSPTQSDRSTTCLIIGLRNKQSGGIEYFRTNINAGSNLGQQLKRNHAYRTIVKGVLNEGSESERGAYNDTELLLDIDINGWLLDESGSIQYDGENVLAMPTREIGLYAQGDNRTFFVHTLGEGTPEIIEKSLPAHIKAELVVPSTGSKFKTGTLIIKADPGTITDEDFYYITVKFATLQSTIRFVQRESRENYLELSHDLGTELVFPPFTGNSSDHITVSSSGRWKARIYQSDYISFAGGGAQTETTGEPGESFKLYTIGMSAQEARYCFVVVALEDAPAVSRVLVLKQSGMNELGEEYLIVTPGEFPNFPASGGSTEKVTVYSSGLWTAEVTNNVNTTAYFQNYPVVQENTLTTTYDGRDGTSFVLTAWNLQDLLQPGSITYTFKLTGTTITKSITIGQNILGESTPVLQIADYEMNGSLHNIHLEYTYNHVYHMAKFMREEHIYDGVKVEPFVFVGGEFKDNINYSHWKPRSRTNIFQIIGRGEFIASTDMIPWHKSDTKKMLMFSNGVGTSSLPTPSTAFYRFIGYFTGYSSSTFYYIPQIDVARNVERYFYKRDTQPDLTNPLYKYLLEDGPYGSVDHTKVSLYSSSGVNAGMDCNHNGVSDTFIPIIMVQKGTAEYCVLGIDIYNRFIWMSDPGIMGSIAGSNLPNEANYTEDKVDNIRFLNNLMAWISLAVTQDGFIERFGEVKK